jgi:hypothetical protein
MTVVNARALAGALSAAADQAEAAGSADFDLIESMRALDNAARAELQAAIDAAKKASGGP